MSPSNDITKATSWHIAPDYYGHWLVHAHVPDLENALCFAKCQTKEHAEFICARLVACGAIVGDPVKAIHDAAEALCAMSQAHKALMPGIRHIAVQDYALQNEAPLMATSALRALGAIT